ncbi:phosphoenolpyruvate synthase [Geminocystis sp. GBBB08]|uniref:phosphoenolpyruvate synthase n=1 Tax=Geminocystis sp. GBBB08 TaxID=2604140 RepID=UPI0027E379AD|nr:phosphoenolpyruvate synthase [Geminocystis sp. GBBB08]MBL1209015.1 phosphoenolpyruvate synthase [Geminocystis sp. GBBB08]
MVSTALETIEATTKQEKFVLWFEEVGIEDVPMVGGKNASLGEMIQQLTAKGVNVPTGFATTAYAYRYFVKKAGLEEQLRKIFADLDVENLPNLQAVGRQARALVLNTPFPKELDLAISEAYFKLCQRYGNNPNLCTTEDEEEMMRLRNCSYDTDVAVRSSATAEDLPDASFAGQQETYLNVHGVKNVLDACHKCFASIFTDRAISYRTVKNFDHFEVALSVGVQKMVRSDLASSGVMFSIDTETGFKDAAFVTSAYGLGENVVQGAVNPDEFFVFKPTLKQGFKPILNKRLGSKEIKMVYDLGGGKQVKNVPVSESERLKYSITDEEALILAKWACIIEDHYSEKRGQNSPMDIEWAKDGQTGQLFIVQARPETVQSQKSGSVLRDYKLKGTSEILVTGRAVGEMIGQGQARVILDVHKIGEFKAGEVLVTNKTDPDWEPIMKKASAIVTNQGGRTCFDGNTKILTNQGFMSLKEIYDQGYQGLSTIAFNPETQKMQWKPILDVMKRRSNLMTVSVSQTGRVLDNILSVTPDHKMVNLRQGEYVKTEIQEMLSQKEMVLVSQNVPTLPVNNTRGDVDLAYLLGGIITDGGVYLRGNRGEVQFIQKETPEKEAFIATMNEKMTTVYGKSFTPHLKAESSGYIRGEKITGQATAYRLHSKSIAQDLQAQEASITQQLLTNSTEFAYHFLAGVIDGDGCYHKNRINIYISEENLLQGVIIACLKINTVPQVTRNRNIHNVQIVEKLEEILQYTQRVKGDITPRQIQTRFFSASQLLSEDVTGQLKLRKDKNLLISEKQLRETGGYESLLDSDVRMQRIIKVSEPQPADVYNITVANHHNYLVFTSKYTPILVCNCHAAIIAREMGIPAIVGCGNATGILKTGQDITVSCSEGEEGRVYSGLVPFDIIETQLDNLPKTHTKILMNVGNPEEAFKLASIPCDGVGLARLEFIIANHIKAHPLALMKYDELTDESVKKEIAQLTLGYENKADFFVDKVAQGVGTIASAFYPNPVVVRMSDFKSNEYANLLGGADFETKEENPMIGWRGASRYYDEKYRDAYGLECKALKRVRDEMGLTNVIPMIPFCRTPYEGRRVLAEMEKHGLKRGENGLQVYVMCEIPSNVILADQYSEIFDGFSIGSNDLTQLTLGLDRDSSLVAHIFDERNQAVKDMVAMVIEKAKRNNRKIGICGQAPSDYPEFARFLVELGIDSISLNPDSLLKTLLDIAKLEERLDAK